MQIVCRCCTTGVLTYNSLWNQGEFDVWFRLTTVLRYRFSKILFFLFCCSVFWRIKSIKDEYNKTQANRRRSRRVVAACRQWASRCPWRHSHVGASGRRLPIQRIAHLDNDEHRQCTGLGFGGVEYVAVDARKHSWLGRTLHMMSLATSSRHWWSLLSTVTCENRYQLILLVAPPTFYRALVYLPVCLYVSNLT